MIDLAVALPTLVGSIFSVFAAAFIFICYLTRSPQRHFRHTLILNLAAADFFNAINNTTSGIYAILHKSIPPGHGCTFNGWIGQLTAQATDFSMLSIAIATLITLRRSSSPSQMSWREKLLISCGVWVVPLTTSATGLALNAYHPVSGNWCSIRSDQRALRYALDHAWRLTIIFTIIILYTYIFIWLNRHFSSLRQIHSANDTDDTVAVKTWSGPVNRRDESLAVGSAFHVYENFKVCEVPFEKNMWCEATQTVSTAHTEKTVTRDDWQTKFPTHHRDLEIGQNLLPLTPLSSSPINAIAQNVHQDRSVLKSATWIQPFLTRDPLVIVRRQPQNGTSTPVTSLQSPQSATPQAYPPTVALIKAQEQLLYRRLLLNSYPIAYSLLWISGVVNLFFELSGHQSRVLAVLQASAQFVGLANAIIYSCNERVWEQWRRRNQEVERPTPVEGEKREVVGNGSVIITWPRPYL